MYGNTFYQPLQKEICLNLVCRVNRVQYSFKVADIDTYNYDLLGINESLRAPLGGWRDLLRVINLYLHDLLDMKERAFSGSLRDL